MHATRTAEDKKLTKILTMRLLFAMIERKSQYLMHFATPTYAHSAMDELTGSSTWYEIGSGIAINLLHRNQVNKNHHFEVSLRRKQ